MLILSRQWLPQRVPHPIGRGGLADMPWRPPQRSQTTCKPPAPRLQCVCNRHVFCSFHVYVIHSEGEDWVHPPLTHAMCRGSKSHTPTHMQNTHIPDTSGNKARAGGQNSKADVPHCTASAPIAGERNVRVASLARLIVITRLVRGTMPDYRVCL